MTSRTLLSLPDEILRHVSVYLHPHTIGKLIGLSRLAYQILRFDDLPFARANLAAESCSWARVVNLSGGHSFFMYEPIEGSLKAHKDADLDLNRLHASYWAAAAEIMPFTQFETAIRSETKDPWNFCNGFKRLVAILRSGRRDDEYLTELPRIWDDAFSNAMGSDDMKLSAPLLGLNRADATNSPHPAFPWLMADPLGLPVLPGEVDEFNGHDAIQRVFDSACAFGRYKVVDAMIRGTSIFKSPLTPTPAQLAGAVRNAPIPLKKKASWAEVALGFAVEMGSYEYFDILLDSGITASVELAVLRAVASKKDGFSSYAMDRLIAYAKDRGLNLIADGMMTRAVANARFKLVRKLVLAAYDIERDMKLLLFTAITASNAPPELVWMLIDGRVPAVIKILEIEVDLQVTLPKYLIGAAKTDDQIDTTARLIIDAPPSVFASLLMMTTYRTEGPELFRKLIAAAGDLGRDVDFKTLLKGLAGRYDTGLMIWVLVEAHASALKYLLKSDGDVQKAALHCLIRTVATNEQMDVLVSLVLDAPESAFEGLLNESLRRPKPEVFAKLLAITFSAKGGVDLRALIPSIPGDFGGPKPFWWLMEGHQDVVKMILKSDGDFQIRLLAYFVKTARLDVRVALLLTILDGGPKAAKSAPVILEAARLDESAVLIALMRNPLVAPADIVSALADGGCTPACCRAILSARRDAIDHERLGDILARRAGDEDFVDAVISSGVLTSEMGGNAALWRIIKTGRHKVATRLVLRGCAEPTYATLLLMDEGFGEAARELVRDATDMGLTFVAALGEEGGRLVRFGVEMTEACKGLLEIVQALRNTDAALLDNYRKVIASMHALKPNFKALWHLHAAFVEVAELPHRPAVGLLLIDRPGRLHKIAGLPAVMDYHLLNHYRDQHRPEPPKHSILNMFFTNALTLASVATAFLAATPANGARIPLDKNAKYTPSHYEPEPTPEYYEPAPTYPPMETPSYLPKPSSTPSTHAPMPSYTPKSYTPPSTYAPEPTYAPASSGGYVSSDDTSLICPHTIPSQPHGCRLFVRGFDITGVTTEVDLTIADGIMTECDCLARCSASSTQCVSWVWKFTDNSGHRTCTLYSNFNLPSAVTLAYNVQNSTDIMKLQAANNPQGGSTIPQCTVDGQAGSKPDPDCFSGSVWVKPDNSQIC
ncbi:hypothetical protein HK101_008950 [Irineochytrium annulatum]|nr:hypothetical protein HK101_008950 [Irineochytrium annulatum]